MWPKRGIPKCGAINKGRGVCKKIVWGDIYLTWFSQWRYNWEHWVCLLFLTHSLTSYLGQVEGLQGSPLRSVSGSSRTVGGYNSPHGIHQPGQRRTLLFRGDPGCPEQDAGWQPGHGVRGHHLPHMRMPRRWTLGFCKKISPIFPSPASTPWTIPLSLPSLLE